MDFERRLRRSHPDIAHCLLATIESLSSILLINLFLQTFQISKLLEKNAKERQKLKDTKGLVASTSTFNLGKEIKDASDNMLAAKMTSEEVHEVSVLFFFEIRFLQTSCTPFDSGCLLHICKRMRKTG